MSPRSPAKRITERFNDPNSEGSDYDDNFPVSGTGAGKAPTVPSGPIREEDKSDAIIKFRNRIEWLEAREGHYVERIADLKQEIAKMQLEAIDRQRSLHVDAIRATLKTIQGISSTSKRIQTCPHDMDATFTRVKKYKIPWRKVTVPARDINPFPVQLKMLTWETIEEKRIESFPDDKPTIPISWYIKSFELKAGSAKDNKAQVDEFSHREEGRRGRGEHNARFRGYRGSRGRGYRGN
jgi:hypothetical protein